MGEVPEARETIEVVGATRRGEATRESQSVVVDDDVLLLEVVLVDDELDDSELEEDELLDDESGVVGGGNCLELLRVSFL